MGVLLAGGTARRMGGGEKCLLRLGDKTVLDQVIARALPQVDSLLLNTNSEASRFTSYRLPLVPDTVPGFPGPLAGILAAMEWLRDREPEVKWLSSFPADSPFFSGDVVNRLMRRIRESGAPVACAASRGRRSPLFALWSIALLDDLSQQLQKEERKVESFQDRHQCQAVLFDHHPVDPFYNINTAEDLEAARTLISSGKLL